MNPKLPISTDQVDSLVRSALRADAKTVDVDSIEAAIVARQSINERRSNILRIPNLLKSLAAAAAMVVLAAGVISYFVSPSTSAIAHEIVSSAHAAQLENVDRCYRVDWVTLPRTWGRARAFVQVGDETTLWTRGDRVRLESMRDGQEIVWGQDESQRFWRVVDSKVGLLFEPHEIPQNFREALAILNLDARSLTEDILHHYDLVVEPSSPGHKTVLATLRDPSRSKLHSSTVRIEIEDNTNAIVRLEVVQEKRKAEVMRLHFTLVGEQWLDDAEYQLAGNLDPDAEVFAEDQGRQRTKWLRGLSDN
ncbi:MAG: hypothetical protein RIC12_00490 [Pirellulales bacterium]